MTHLLDTSALLAHHLAEPGADAVQALFDDDTKILGACVLNFFEFELRLNELGLSQTDRRVIVERYRALIDDIVAVTEQVCEKAIELKLAASARLPNADALIAASASINAATLIHRDPHFLNIPANLLSQQVLPQKIIV